MPGQEIIPGLVLDTTREGLNAFFERPWAAQILEELLTREDFTSREIHKFCVENDIGAPKKGNVYGTISRASVINFLNHLVDQGILGYKIVSGKGGKHRRFHPLMTEDALFGNILHTMLTKINQLFPDKFDYPLKG